MIAGGLLLPLLLLQVRAALLKTLCHLHSHASSSQAEFDHPLL